MSGVLSMLTEIQTNACCGQTKRNDGINCTHENMLKHFNISRKEEILIENKCHFCRDNNKYFQRVLGSLHCLYLTIIIYI